MYIDIVISIKSASSTKVSLITLLYFLNSAQLLNATCVAAVTSCFLWGWAPALAAAMVLVRAIFPVTKVYASE